MALWAWRTVARPRTSAEPIDVDTREASRMLRALTTHSPYGIFKAAADGSCEYVNERWCELTGLTREQALGDGWAAALHPDDKHRVRDELRHAIAEGLDWTVSCRFLRPDGTILWIQGFASPLRDDEGVLTGWVGTCLDLTARKEAEEALLRSSERFRVAFDNAPIGVALLTPDGRWFHVNRALCELLGYSAEELYDLTFADLTHPDDLAANLERSRQQLEGGEWERRIEKRYIRADGEVIWVALSNEVVRDDDGEALYFVAQIEDITQRRHTEKALQEAEERFRRAFDDAPIGMALVAPDGRFLRVNRALCEVTGYGEPDLLERTFQQITHPDDLDHDVDLAQRLLAGELPRYQIEKRYLRRDGTIVWVMLSVSLVRDEDGDPLYFVSEIEDIGDRKRAEQELQRLAKYDALTGLGNRRKLTFDLERTLASGDGLGPRLLIIFDLNGFKHYNDTFGHPAGDALLGRLAAKLADAARPHGEAYRLGGDEFCVLAVPPADEVEGFLSSAAAALQEKGDGFSISSSFGVAFLPEEAANPSSALSLADQRLYAQKHEFHAGRGEPHEVLLRAICEREPSLRDHIDEVTELSVAVGARLGVSGEGLEELRLAAELHDVGKLAIPDAVLLKRGPLSDEEWILMRQHTLIGQRILAAAPALGSIGEIVRATHERWDGKGYPDGLIEKEIPVAARIIAVCDAYVAMTSDRPYRLAMSPMLALAELRNHAGGQFDPEVVRVFCSEVAQIHDAEALRAELA
jgi:PAS domain S-box-containing protein/diguanylate cyclase (GGDEF)-like protein